MACSLSQEVGFTQQAAVLLSCISFSIGLKQIKRDMHWRLALVPGYTLADIGATMTGPKAGQITPIQRRQPL